MDSVTPGGCVRHNIPENLVSGAVPAVNNGLLLDKFSEARMKKWFVVTVACFWTMGVVGSWGMVRAANALCLTVDAGPDTLRMCQGETATLGGNPTASGGTPPYSYYWWPTNGLDNPNAANPSFTPTTTGTYHFFLSVGDNGQCWGEDEIVVIVSAPPTAEAGTNQQVCVGESVQLGGSPTASGGTPPYTYQWTPTTGLDNANAANPEFTPSSAGLYEFIVTVTDANGCHSSDVVAITAVGAPTADAGSDTTVCIGDTVQLGGTPTASGGTPPYTYSWSPAAGLSNASSANPVFTASTPGTYELVVTVTDGTECTASDTVRVVVYELSLDPGPTQEICIGETVQLGGMPTVSGGVLPYTYQWSPSSGLDDPTSANPTFTASTPGIYEFTVTVTDGNGCTAIGVAAVIVNPKPSLQVPTEVVGCGSTPVLLGGNPSAVGGTPPYSYSWGPATHLDDASSANPVFTPPGTGTYVFYVIVTDAKGCSDTATVVVGVEPGPTASAGPDRIGCWSIKTEGAQVQLGGSPSAAGGTPPYTYAWSPQAGLDNPASANPTFSTLQMGTFTFVLTVTDARGCSDSDTVTVTVVGAPAAVADAEPLFQCEDHEALEDSVDLEGTVVGGTPPYQYRWEELTPQGRVYVGNTPVVRGVGLPGAGVYPFVFTVTDANGCSDEDIVVVEIGENPEVLIDAPQVICVGTTIRFDVDVDDGQPPYTYDWQGGSGLSRRDVKEPFFTPSHPGRYQFTLKVTDINGCWGEDVITIDVAGPPVVTQQPQDMTVCEGNVASFQSSAQSTLPTGRQWQISTDGGNSWQEIGGATQAQHTVSNVNRTMNGYQYRIVYDNMCGTAVSAPAQLTVWTTAAIVRHPQTQVVCEGSIGVFTAAAKVGTPQTPLSVRWQFSTDGGKQWWDLNDIPGYIQGTQTDQLRIAATAADDGNWYRAVYTTPCGVTPTNAARLDFYALPRIRNQSSGVALCPGEAFQLSVTATGTALQYQWYRFDAQGIARAIPGATQPTYGVNNAQLQDAGFYFVAVWNVCRTVTTNTVAVFVYEPTQLVQPPFDQRVCVGDDAQFVALAQGSGLQYRWFKDGQLIAQGSSVLSLAAVTKADTGTYRVEVQGVCGTVSAEATLVVEEPPKILAVQQEPSGTICAGETVRFSVIAVGDRLEYRWYKEGKLVGTGSVLEVPEVEQEDEGEYIVVVSGACEPTDTGRIRLRVIPQPAIVEDLDPNWTVCAGATLQLFVTATGSQLSYQWQYRSDPQEQWQDVQWTPTATTPTLVINHIQQQHSGWYRVQISGQCLQLQTSAEARVVVKMPVVVTQQPQHQSICVGDSFTLEVAAEGSPAEGEEELRYQWFFNGSALPGATGRQLYIAAATLSHFGEYWCEIEGYCQTVRSQSAMVSIGNVPVVELYEPKSITAVAGETVRLRANTNGQGLHFQWYRGNIPLQDDGRITGTQSSVLTLRSVTMGDAGDDYAVVVTGACGTRRSENATLTVLVPDIQILHQPQDQAVCRGSAAVFTVEAASIATNAVLRYQWYKDGAAIEGATTATLVLPSSDFADQGRYAVRIMDWANGVEVWSHSAVLRIYQPETQIQIVQQPYAVCAGESVVLKVQPGEHADGTSYQWYRDGEMLPDAVAPELVIPAPESGATYWVEKTTPCGRFRSQPLPLVVKAATRILHQFPSGTYTLAAGERAHFQVQAIGEGPVQYQWYRNGEAIAGATEPTLVLYGVPEVEGVYWCHVAAECGIATTDPVYVAYRVPVAVGEQEPLAEGILFHYPEPVRQRAQIHLFVAQSASVQLTVQDLYGRKTVVLLHEFLTAGWHTVTFNPAAYNLSSGMYMLILSVGKQQWVEQMLILR